MGYGHAKFAQFVYYSKAEVDSIILYTHVIPPEMDVDFAYANTIIMWNVQTLHGHNLHTLQYFSIKLGSYTNFGALEMDFPFFACIQILDSFSKLKQVKMITSSVINR